MAKKQQKVYRPQSVTTRQEIYKRAIKNRGKAKATPKKEKDDSNA